MRKDILTSFLAIVVFTVLCGVVYPLAVTGVSQVAFARQADGSMITRNGKPVGSELVAQSFGGRKEYFQPRPSQTDYNPSATAFNNAGPNNLATRDLIAENAAAFLKLERPFRPRLTLADVPVDAATGSASGIDPHISEQNAAIQAVRVAKVRGLAADRVSELVSSNTDGRFLGVFGEPGVNVLQLNLALDKEQSR